MAFLSHPMSFLITTYGMAAQVFWPLMELQEQMKQPRMILERNLMAQALAPERLEEMEAAGPALCDACGVKALVKCSLPFGTLSFCMHHYNKHQEALKAKGAVVTPLL